MRTRSLQYLTRGVLTAVAYIVTARMGLTLAFVAEQVTVVWPPTGIALCAVLLLGYRVWPFIAIGAFIANLLTNAPALTSLGIATGNTLEAVVGAFLLNRFVGFRPSLDRFRDIFGMILLAGGLSTAISATIGVISLCATGLQQWERFAQLWGVWFLGDAMGDVLIAPLVLSLASPDYRRRLQSRIPEFLGLVAILSTLDLFAFGGLNVSPSYLSPHYAIVPILIWAALRFGLCGTAIGSVVTAGIAVLGTVRGLGPFAGGTTNENLISLQLFMFVASVTGLIVAVLEDGRRKAEREMAEGNRRKDEFLAMLAHELRNPLAPIRNAVEIIRTSKDDPALIDWTCEIMVRQVHHMSRLLDDLLDVSRITRGRIQLSRHSADLRLLVERSLDVARPLIEKRELQLVTKLVDGPVPISADSTRIDQVITNLLNNAMKFTPAGGHITVTVEREGDTAILRVRDTGRGISAELLPQIFDLFTQGDRSLARSEGGLGIGLTLVQNLVRMHSGTVAAKSEGPGHGSEFTVRLPMLPVVPLPSVRKDNERSARAGNRRRVLIVEDNVDSAETLAAMLDAMGHEAHIAHDGDVGLQLFSRIKPSIVLLDIGLPGINGFEVAERLRADGANVNLRIIALTGYGSEADQQRGKEAGFDHHLVKPVDFEVLEKLLR